MEWYYYLGAIAYGIFVLQFILSWFMGDVDLDVDFDGTADFDTGDLLSFKGLIHFSMGLSGWLMLKHKLFETVMWYDYVIGAVWGIYFVVILYFLYRLILKFESETTEWEDQVGRIATIYLIYEGQYFLSIEGRAEHLVGCPENLDIGYKKGDTVLITKYEGGKYYF